MSVGEIMYRLLELPLLRHVRQSDIITHVKTVLELIGVPGLQEKKTIQLQINDYRAELPDDFKSRLTVRVVSGDTRIALTHMTDSYGEFNKEYDANTFIDTTFSHKIVNQFIYTDFREGTIELVYWAYLTDEKGWPLIPRNESLYLAIENYIKSRHYGSLADQNANFERAYQRAEQQYCWYLAQATTSLLTLDPVEAKALGDMLVRLVPIKENFYTDDKYSGQPERMNRKIW
jgi:hypothetical protein